MEVEEELEPGTRLGEVTAIDEDIRENAAINYAIICEYNTVLSLILKFKSLIAFNITYLCFLIKMEINNLYFQQMGMMRESSRLNGTRITEASSD